MNVTSEQAASILRVVGAARAVLRRSHWNDDETIELRDALREFSGYDLASLTPQPSDPGLPVQPPKGGAAEPSTVAPLPACTRCAGDGGWRIWAAGYPAWQTCTGCGGCGEDHDARIESLRRMNR